MATSQSRTVASLDAVATVFPSGLKATEVRFLVCPARTARVVFDATSHSRAVRSLPAVASNRPSGLKATDRTEPVCPSKLAIRLCDAVSQRITLGFAGFPESRLPEASTPPVGAEGQRRHGGGMSLPARHEPAGGRVPELDRLALVGVVAAGGQDLAVGREGGGPGLGGVAGKRVGLWGRIEPPDPWASCRPRGSATGYSAGSPRWAPRLRPGKTASRVAVAISQTSGGCGPPGCVSRPSARSVSSDEKDREWDLTSRPEPEVRIRDRPIGRSIENRQLPRTGQHGQLRSFRAERDSGGVRRHSQRANSRPEAVSQSTMWFALV